MYKILYVDDNKSLTKLFQCMGSEYKFKALIANSVNEGYQKTLELRPDVVITDVEMADGDGLTLTAKIKTNVEIQHIPIIGCSITYADKASKFMLVGGTKFINDKPTTFKQLNEMLSDLLPQLFSQN